MSFLEELSKLSEVERIAIFRRMGKTKLMFDLIMQELGLDEEINEDEE